MTCLTNDQRFMRAALRFSLWHLGMTAENPSVGAILVNQKKNIPAIISQAITSIGGRPHAETQVLDLAGDLAKGTTLYVTLEPCAHFGKTGPCAQAIINAQVERVVIALVDPDIRVAGQGIHMLRQAGVKVDVGIENEYAKCILHPYLIRKKLNRTAVTLKLAISEDNGIGLLSKGNFPVSNNISRMQAHILRATHDAILIGYMTALLDDPSLTCRLNGLKNRSPIKIILDPQLNIPLNTKLIKNAQHEPLWLLCADNIPDEKYKFLLRNHVKIFKFTLKNGKLDGKEIIDTITKAGINNLLIEGGAQTAQTFINSNVIDKLALFKTKVNIGKCKVPAPNLNLLYENFIKLEPHHYKNDLYEEWIRPI